MNHFVARLIFCFSAEDNDIAVQMPHENISILWRWII